MSPAGAGPRRAPLSGAAIYVAAGLAFIAADTLTKVLVTDAPVVSVIFGRHLSAFFIILLVAGGRHPRRLLAARRPGLQLLRGATMFGTTVVFFFALSLLPIGTVSALSNSSPLFVLLLASPLLGERVPWRSVAGALVGFAGVVAITGPDIGAIDPRLLVPIAFAVVYAFFSILSRSLRDEDANVTVFWSAMVCLAGGLVAVTLFPPAVGPTDVQWAGIFLLGAMAMTGHWILVVAFRRASASSLAPLGYLGVVWSFLVGAFVFGDAFDARAIVGAVAIVVGGLIALRNTNVSEPAAPLLPVEAE